VDAATPPRDLAAAPAEAAAPPAEGLPPSAVPPPDEPPPPETPRSLRGLRERTPELELLISGAVLFALFRLSDVADESFQRFSLHLGGTAWMAAMLAYEYTKLILYTLIVAFVTHLVARAWWIALIGIDAVFPGGPRWEELKYGPATVEMLRRRSRPVPEGIVQANAVATTVFATGLAFALLFVLSVAGSAFAVLAGWLLSRLVPGLEPERAIFGLLIVVGAALLVVSFLDKVAGERLLRSRRGGGWLRRAVTASSALTGALLVAPITLAIATNLPKRRVYAGFIGGLALVMGLFLVRDVLLGFGALSIGSHTLLPAQPGAAGVDPVYYEAYRPPFGRTWELPSLAEEVASGPYVRLFVPFSPERVERGAKDHCPGLSPPAAEGFLARARRGVQTPEQATAALAARDCLAKLVVVRLDGRPLPASEFVVAVHPVSGARGLAAYLPAAGLAPGRHQLVVAEVPPRRPGKRPPRTHHIHFWR
jgi:hypothetical protein